VYTATKLLEHPILVSMRSRRKLQLSQPLPIGLNPFVEAEVKIHIARAFGELKSVKDMVAYEIITRKLKSGELRPGGTAIDASSGGTAFGYAAILQPLGINLRVIVKSSVPPGKLAPLHFFGQGVEVVSHTGSGSPVERAREEAEKFGYVLLDQYANEANPDAHSEHLAPALHAQAGGIVDVIVVPLGTCGTAVGFSRYFKRIRHRRIRIVGVAVDSDTTGGKVPQIPGMRTLEEIEQDVRLIKLPCPEVIDDVRLVTRAAAVRSTRKLAYVEPRAVGLSSGAAYAAALSYVEENLGNLKAATVVVIAPDSLEPYLGIMNAEQDDANINHAMDNRPAF
jgi:cysteine synthase